MSRSERRAYQRMMKNQDPYAPPAATAAARARMEQRQRSRRGPAAQGSKSASLLGGRTGWIVFGGGAAAFLLGFSVAWPGGVAPALLAGIGAGLAWMAVTLGFAVWIRRASAARTDGRGAGSR